MGRPSKRVAGTERDRRRGVQVRSRKRVGRIVESHAAPFRGEKAGPRVIGNGWGGPAQRQVSVREDDE